MSIRDLRNDIKSLTQSNIQDDNPHSITNLLKFITAEEKQILHNIIRNLIKRKYEVENLRSQLH